MLFSVIGPQSAVTRVAEAKSSSIVLTPSVPSPQPVGTPIVWTAQTVDAMPLLYRFSVRSLSSGSIVALRDFSPRNTFMMTPLDQGTYQVQVTIQHSYFSHVRASTVASYMFTSRVQGKRAVVSSTANPLVALYSAPACFHGSMYVAFRQARATHWQHTGAQPCRSLRSLNFLVAGMLANTTYEMKHVTIGSASMRISPSLFFTTGTPPKEVTFPGFTQIQAPGPHSDTTQNQLVHLLSPNPSRNAANPVATTLDGNVTWYADQADLTNVWPVRVHPLPATPMGNVTFLFGTDDQPPVGPVSSEDVFRTIDLAGNPLLETNIKDLNAQLVSRGNKIIYGFSHEAFPLPNGDIAVWGYREEIVHGQRLLGDMLIVLNPFLRVVWTWDTFDHLNPNRGPILGDTCVGSPSVLCPVPGYPNVVDWSHANAIAYSATDGNLMVSLRNQAWVLKINYRNGRGNGAILWRLGKDGDFRLVPLHPNDPYPWFSYQHNSNYIDTNDTMVEVFDDGNVRCTNAPSGTCNSRGQVYQLNERTRVATQTFSSSVGVYASSQGTAQRLTNGNFNFTAGEVTSPSPAYARDVELLPDGSITYVLQVNTPEYRAWRLSTLYSPLIALIHDSSRG
ncbi:MAG TPA: aryl-sulfate sulfotransferase [Dictyobacter sp.]|nr:aryl-sulfate sulfotransferase [Dictyobacter sp.]